MVSFSGAGDRYLPIYAHDEAEVDLTAIKAAKQALQLDFKVYPQKATIDTTSRVLAVGGRPPFLCDYALISPRSDERGVQAAVAWVLSDDVDPRATTVLDTLNSILGPGVREISQEELDAEQRFRDYQRNAA